MSEYKIRTDLSGDLTLPASLAKRFPTEKSCDEEGNTFPNCEKCPYLEECLTEFLRDELSNVNGKLIPKDEAEFLATWVTSDIPAEGGYPVRDAITFEDNGKYRVIAFAWTSDLDNKESLSLVAYKYTELAKNE